MTDSKVETRGPIGSRSVPPNRGAMDEQPRWRRDFPIDWEEDEYVSRRDLTKYVVLTSGAFAVGQLWIVLKSLFGRPSLPKGARAVAGVDELKVGGAKTFNYPENSTPRLLVKTGPSEFVAYDQLCTHLQCPVVPAVEQGKLHCPCHNGNFDLETGRVLSGPPERPLPRIELRVQGDIVYATGRTERVS